MTELTHFIYFSAACVVIPASILLWVFAIDRVMQGGAVLAWSPRSKVPWSIIDLLVLAILFLIIMVGTRQVAHHVFDVPMQLDDMAEMGAEATVQLLSVFSASELVFLAAALVYLAIRSGARARDLGIDRNRLGADVKIGVSGYLMLAARLRTSDDPMLCSGWNFGPRPGNELPVREVVEMFLEFWGEGSWEDVSCHTHAHESNILRLSIDKALWQLGWKPGWNIERTLAETARWYRSYYGDAATIRNVAFEQIAAYRETLEQQSGTRSAKSCELALT